MLSRIAESLFWIGRYIERTENMARYADVQYYTTMDIPIPGRKQMVMESILSMYDCEEEYFQRYTTLSEKKLFYFAALDQSNPMSMFSAVAFARENARGIRESVSIELWENLNKFYHSVKDYSPENFQKKRDSRTHQTCHRILLFAAWLHRQLITPRHYLELSQNRHSPGAYHPDLPDVHDQAGRYPENPRSGNG